MSLRRPQGAVITPAAAIEPSLSIHPSTVMAPLTQQMNHLSLGTTGTVSHLQTFFKRHYIRNMIAIIPLSSRISTLIRLNYSGFLSFDTCCDPGWFCCDGCCESVRQDFNSRHPGGPAVCIYVLILSAPPLPPSAVHACCSCCSYARNLHSPVHCSACLCHHSGSKKAKAYVVFLFCSSLADLWLWFWTNLLAWNKTLKSHLDTIMKRRFYVWSMTNCSFKISPILEGEQEIK